jgi:hypothetical protein
VTTTAAAVTTTTGVVTTTTGVATTTPFEPTHPVDLSPCDSPDSCMHPLSDRARWEIPVVSVAYLPDADGDGTVDFEATNWNGTVDQLRARIEGLNNEGAWWGTEASRYRGRAGDLSDPSVAFRIVDQVFLESAVPPGLEVPWKPGEGWYRPDYLTILSDLDVCRWVDGLGVRELWMWTQQHGGIEPAESNMAGPFGDISNSERSDDLPICEHSYTLYNFNFTRTVSEMLHNRGHQAEALFRRGDPVLWDLFVGSVGAGADPSTVSGCGDTHFPPNAAAPYDYRNPRVVLTDCMDWRPSRDGAAEAVSCATWFEHTYGRPDCFEDGGLAFYVWWFQGMPGRDNGLTYQGAELTDWWGLFADLEAAATGTASWLLG